jgi:hypothetical protein
MDDFLLDVDGVCTEFLGAVARAAHVNVSALTIVRVEEWCDDEDWDDWDNCDDEDHHKDKDKDEDETCEFEWGHWHRHHKRRSSKNAVIKSRIQLHVLGTTVAEPSLEQFVLVSNGKELQSKTVIQARRIQVINTRRSTWLREISKTGVWI